ncbi:MAG: class B sortase, partial [Lachnospiraceae bacterium]|nr:class B sortase [Lachnospiraceae bacterium]
HNMDNGSMFGKFRNMTEEDYETQPFLWLCTKEKDGLYKMISLHISLVDDESYTLFKSNGEVNRLNYENSVVTGWLRAENQRSYINMPVPKSALGRVITLSTCASLSDERRVLQAVLVREIARPP